MALASCAAAGRAASRPLGQRPGQSRVGRLDPAVAAAVPEADEFQRRPGVFGDNLQQAVHQRRLDQLAGAQIRQDPYREVAAASACP